MLRKVSVGDIRPGGADLDELFLLDLAGALTVAAMHLDGALADPVFCPKPLGLGLPHGAALAVLEVVELLPPSGLGRGPVGSGNDDALAAVVLAEVPALPLV